MHQDLDSQLQTSYNPNAQENLVVFGLVVVEKVLSITAQTTKLSHQCNTMGKKNSLTAKWS